MDRLDKVREKVEAGAAGVVEKAREVRDRAGEVVERAGEALERVKPEVDAEVKASVSGATEHGLHVAGDRIEGAAPAIGRGAELAARATGQALHFVARPLAVVLGVIAGAVGGWWNRASEAAHGLPPEEDEACRVHFTTVSVRPAGMTYEQARTGYALGFLAAGNPAYVGRTYEDVEPDLRAGFGPEHADEYEALRPFTMHGYERGLSRPSGTV